MLERTRDRLGLKPRCLAADGSYGTGPFLSWLMERGVEPHVPVLCERWLRCLVEVFKDRWSELSGGKPIVASANVFEFESEDV
jgi:hypothetical protein